MRLNVLDVMKVFAEGTFTITLTKQISQLLGTLNHIVNRAIKLNTTNYERRFRF